MLEFSLLSVFLVGLLGGGHCIGMCGGVVSAVSMTLPQQRPKWIYLLAYNAGRISSYCVVGAIAGGLGSSALLASHLLPVQTGLYALASLMLILLGLYLAGFSQVLTQVERIGQRLWKTLQPYGKRFIPVQHPRQAFCLGLVWGWLPCGLVYSVVIAALASGSAMHGATLMLCFGLGTLPTLLTMGMAAVHLKDYLQRVWVRRASGLMVLGFGVMGLWQVVMK